MVKDPQTETHVGECHSSHQPTGGGGKEKEEINGLHD